MRTHHTTHHTHSRTRTLTASTLTLLCISFGLTLSNSTATPTAPQPLTNPDSAPLAAAAATASATHTHPHPHTEIHHPSDEPVHEPALDLSAEEIDALPEYQVTPTESFAIPGTPSAGSFPTAADDPEHVTIYLDFTGATVTDTLWNIDFNASTLNFDPATIADPQHNPAASTLVHEVWASVAEDYAPFDVNVTTTAPHPDDLTKDSPEDRRFGAHVVITDSYTDLLPAISAGGLAYVGSAGEAFRSPALVFATSMGGGDPLQATAKNLAEGASHEAGHTLGLEHHGVAGAEYFFPSSGIWAPTMGAGYAVPLTQWSAGEYALSTNPEQHDIAVLTDRNAETGYPRSVTTPDGSPYAGALCPEGPIEYGGTYTAADPATGCTITGEPLTVHWAFTGRLTPRTDADTPGSAPAGTQMSLSATPTTAHSVIRSADDTHHYHFTTTGGQFTADLDVVTLHPNLNAALTLTNELGEVIAHHNPAVTQVEDPTQPGTWTLAGLGADVSPALTPGTYTLTVGGSGQGDPFSPDFAFWYPEDFTETGSTGNYRLTLQLDEYAPAPAPDGGSAPGGAPKPDTESTHNSHTDPRPAQFAPHASTPAQTVQQPSTLVNTGATDHSRTLAAVAAALAFAGCVTFLATRKRTSSPFKRR